MLAKHALSQLSYGPVRGSGISDQESDSNLIPDSCYLMPELVGLGRFELPTSRLSSARSNQLSYKPVPDDRYQGSEEEAHFMRKHGIDQARHRHDTGYLMPDPCIRRKGRETRTAARLAEDRYQASGIGEIPGR
jgi:hypothetical protein